MSVNMQNLWVRVFVVGTLFAGQILHGVRLLASPTTFDNFFTPTFDSIFAFPMIIGSIGMVMVWRRIEFRNRIEKYATGFTVFYFIGSLPLHIQTWFTGNVSYINNFPLWFSGLFFLYTIPLLIMWIRLQITDPVTSS